VELKRLSKELLAAKKFLRSDYEMKATAGLSSTSM